MTELHDINQQMSMFDIGSPYFLTEEQIQYYQNNGYIKLKNVLTPETLEFYRKEITSKVIELNTLHLPMEERTTYQKAFLQVVNLWLLLKITTSKEIGITGVPV